jgi:fucose permease
MVMADRIVSILFFLWGFAYGLLGTLNAEIINLLSISPARSIALHNAYWLGYFIGPPAIGHWVLTRFGFKAAFMTGLAIYACGAMAFWPSSVLRSYAGFFISNLMIASGLSVLEIAANPFIAIAGPGRLSESRLCFAQGIQAIGGLTSPILAQKGLFQKVRGVDLFRVQWCYLAVALFVVFLAVVFFYVPLSEASDSDLETVALQRMDLAGLDVDDRIWTKFKLGHFALGTGVLAMFLYVGAQESVSYFWNESTQAVKPGTNSFWDSAISHGMFAFGRFLFSFLAYIGMPPRILLAISISGAFITSLLGLVLPRGNAPLAMLLLTVFFESAIFPLLFAMTLRNQGHNTKFASSALTMAISGGAVWPSVTYGVVTLHPDPTRLVRQALRVTVALYGVSVLIPVAWQSRPMRRWLDPKWSIIPPARRRSSAWTWPASEKAEVAHVGQLVVDVDGPLGPGIEMKERSRSSGSSSSRIT